MKKLLTILFIGLSLTGFQTAKGQSVTHTSGSQLNFFGELINLKFHKTPEFHLPTQLSASAIREFYNTNSTGQIEQVLETLIEYKTSFQPDDWLYYQLIRKVANSISAKSENYQLYTLYKWFLLTRSGYDAFLTISDEVLLFYVRCDENTYNIPNRMYNGKQYSCLNYHDYPGIDLSKRIFQEVEVIVPGATKSFSYRITRLPNFPKEEYHEKDIQFPFYENQYSFKIKLNSQIKNIFANYPVVDFESFLNIPLSDETYQSLIPLLKKNLRGMNLKSGVDYLMRFTRYAFLFENDTKEFGGEKRMSPEQTLLYDQSDCEDRVALFYYLVKEIYNLPMIVLSYPKHVTIAVRLEKPIGKTIQYKGKSYTICEPTPQKTDLQLGQLPPELINLSYEISYVYTPAK